MSDNDIKALWADPKFPGSFEGANTFQRAILHFKKIKISLRRLYKVLASIPEFVMQIKRNNNFPRRHYSNIFGFGKLYQADLAQFPESESMKYVLVLVDVFSHKIFARALKDKSAKTVKSAFEDIFKTVPVPEKLETDKVTKKYKLLIY